MLVKNGYVQYTDTEYPGNHKLYCYAYLFPDDLESPKKIEFRTRRNQIIRNYLDFLQNHIVSHSSHNLSKLQNFDVGQMS